MIDIENLALRALVYKRLAEFSRIVHKLRYLSSAFRIHRNTKSYLIFLSIFFLTISLRDETLGSC